MSDWKDDAACRGMPAEVFFPTSGESRADAEAVCSTCPVRRECADAGRSEHFGIWGGMSERRRRWYRRIPLPKFCAVCEVVRVQGTERYCVDCVPDDVARARRSRQRRKDAS